MKQMGTSEQKRPRRVLVVGGGVVGLPLECRLSQAGQELAMSDFDVLEGRNLRAQLYDESQVGMTKVRAAAELIRRHAPNAVLKLIEDDVRTLGVGFFLGTDVAVAAVDNRAAEIHVAWMATQAGIPFMRPSTRGEDRTADLMVVPPGNGLREPCGLCIQTPNDYALADLRESCGSDDEANPDAGALVFSEHGAIAAALTAECLLRDEFAPPRWIRYTGGIEPKLRTGPLVFSDKCRLATFGRQHGRLEWSELSGRPDELRLGEVLDRACEQLDARPEELLLETDVPFCSCRVCSDTSCAAPAGPGFRVYGPLHRRPICERCGQPVFQEVFPQEVFPPVRMRRRGSDFTVGRELTLADLHAPVGMGFRFRGPAARTWNVCLPVPEGYFC